MAYMCFKLALSEINNSSQLLDNYNLVATISDTRSDRSTTLKVTLQQIQEKGVVAIVGKKKNQRNSCSFVFFNVRHF